MIEITVTCDTGSCPEFFTVNGADAIATASRKLHNAGWHASRFYQACPKHAGEFRK